jgi:hypothetical protein
MDWANSAAPADVQYPAAGVENAGYANNDPFPHEEANGIFARISEHVSWLREIFPGAGTALIDEDVVRLAAAEVDPVELTVSAPVSSEQQVDLRSSAGGGPETFFAAGGFVPSALSGAITSLYNGAALIQENMCKASGVFTLAGPTTISSSTLDSLNLGSMNAHATITDAWEIAVTNNTGAVRGQIAATVGYNLTGTDSSLIGTFPMNVTASWDDTGKKIVLKVYIWNTSTNDWDVIPPGASTVLDRGPGGVLPIVPEIHVEVK